MNRGDGPDFMNGPNGVKALAKKMVRHAAMELRAYSHDRTPEPEPEPEPEPNPEPRASA